MDYIYIALLSKVLYICLTFTHSYTDGGVNHARLTTNTSGAVRVRDTSTLS